MNQQIALFKRKCINETLSSFEDRINNELKHPKFKNFHFKTIYQSSDDKCAVDVYVFAKDVADHEDELKHDMD